MLCTVMILFCLILIRSNQPSLHTKKAKSELQFRDCTYRLSLVSGPLGLKVHIFISESPLYLRPANSFEARLGQDHFVFGRDHSTRPGHIYGGQQVVARDHDRSNGGLSELFDHANRFRLQFVLHDEETVKVEITFDVVTWQLGALGVADRRG